MSELLSQVMRLVAKRFKLDPAELDPSDDIFERLGIDSFQAVELTSELELEFDVEIPDYELQDVRTFRQLAAAIEKRL